MYTLNKLKVQDFSLENTIESGQFFYFEKKLDFYYIIQNDTIFKIRQESNTLFYAGINIDDNYIQNFFDLNIDLKKLTSDFNQDENLKKSKKLYFGLRNQNLELWQTIIGFVCSSASNISKIKNNHFLLSKYFGEKIIFEKEEYYLFPEFGTLNNLDKIKKSKTGFRAKYILAINTMIKKNPKLLDEIKNSDYKTAKKLLMDFPGIGSKVADCICLFSLNHKEVFPVDTWVKQIIEKLYIKREAKNIKEIEEYVNNSFGQNKGIKQQYLFHWFRHL